MITRSATHRQPVLPFSALLDSYTRQTTVVVLSNAPAIYRKLESYLPAWNVKVTNNPVEFGLLIGLCHPAVVVLDRDITVDGKPHEEVLEPIKWYEIKSRVIAIERPDRRLSRRHYDYLYSPNPQINEVSGLAALVLQAATNPPS